MFLNILTKWVTFYLKFKYILIFWAYIWNTILLSGTTNSDILKDLGDWYRFLRILKMAIGRNFSMSHFYFCLPWLLESCIPVIFICTVHLPPPPFPFWNITVLVCCDPIPPVVQNTRQYMKFHKPKWMKRT
jgi:hypothetical protein